MNCELTNGFELWIILSNPIIYLFILYVLLLFREVIIKRLSKIIYIAADYTFAVSFPLVVQSICMNPLAEMTSLHLKTANISQCKTFYGVKPTHLLRNTWLRTQWYNLFFTYSNISKFSIFLFHFSRKWRIIFLTFNA